MRAKHYKLIYLTLAAFFSSNHGMLTSIKDTTQKLKKEYPHHKDPGVAVNIAAGLMNIVNSVAMTAKGPNHRWILLLGLTPVYIASAQIIAGNKNSSCLNSADCRDINNAVGAASLCTILFCPHPQTQLTAAGLMILHLYNADKVGYIHRFSRSRNERR